MFLLRRYQRYIASLIFFTFFHFQVRVGLAQVAFEQNEASQTT